MSDSENETTVIPLGGSIDPAARSTAVVKAPKVTKPAVADEGEEEEESDDGEDTPSDEEGEEIVEGMEKEAKKLYLGKENGEGEEHEWVDRVSNPLFLPLHDEN